MDDLEFRLRWACRWAVALGWTITEGGMPEDIDEEEPWMFCCPLEAACLAVTPGYRAATACLEIAGLPMTDSERGEFIDGFDQLREVPRWVRENGTDAIATGARLRAWVDAGMPEDPTP